MRGGGRPTGEGGARVMSIKLQLPKLTDLTPRLTVIGVGGAGCNAVNNMIAAGLNGVEFVVANTDAQALAASSAEHRIQLGTNLTEGLGAGSKPEIGEAAAEEAIEDIRAHVSGSHMVFIAAGMGGGTGTGAASVIARVAREAGILTVGVVTKPFQFEGARRMRIAEAGISELRKGVDTLIVIPNQNLFRIANEKTTFAEAFVLADQVLYSGVACIVDLIVKEGLINLDFADVRTVMSGMGTAMMGTGEATGDRRAILAAEEAISNPLLDEVSLKGARGLLLSITGGRDLTLYEVDEAASRVRQEVDAEANIIVGATFDDSLGDRVRVSIVASGMGRITETPGSRSDSTPSQAGWPRTGGVDAAPVAAVAEPVRSVAAAVAPPAVLHAAPIHAAAAQPAATAAAVVIAPDPVLHHVSPYPQPPLRAEAEPARPALAPVRAGEAHAQGAVSEPLEMQRRLADAMKSPETAAAAPHAGAATARETWRAPGNVTIEEGLPHLQASAPPMQPPMQPMGHSAGHAAAGHDYDAAAAGDGLEFTPLAPSEPLRPAGGRRMPEVGDFPPVGQRDYHAKSGAAEAYPYPPMGQHALPQAAHAPVHTPANHGAPQAPNPAPAAHEPEPRRKAGFFERLTGRPWHASESNHVPRASDSQSGAARQPTASSPPERPRQTVSHSGERGAPRAPQRGAEGAELPVFFNRDR